MPIGRRNSHLSNSGLRRVGGWGLVEVIVVIGVIGILAAMTVRMVSKARGQAELLECQTRQRQIAQAVIGYATDHRGRLPPSPAAVFDNRWTAPFDVRRLQNGQLPGVLMVYLQNPEVLLCPLGGGDIRKFADTLAGTQGVVRQSYFLLWNYREWDERVIPGASQRGAFIGRASLDQRNASDVLVSDVVSEAVTARATQWISPHGWEGASAVDYGLWEHAGPPPADRLFNVGYIDGSVRAFRLSEAHPNIMRFSLQMKYWLPPERID